MQKKKSKKNSIDTLMKKKNLSNRDIALKFKPVKCRTTISRWRNGNRIPTPADRRQLAKLLGVKVKDLGI